MRAKPDRRRKQANSPQPVDPALLSVLDQMPVLVWTTDRKLRCTAAIGGARLFAGFNASQFVGKNVREIVHPGSTQAVAGHRRALGGDPARYRTEFRGKTFEASVEPLVGPSGSIVGTVGAALDVTQRHVAEQLATRHQTLLQAIVHKGWEGLVLNDRSGNIMYCNRAAPRLLGIKEADLIGKDAANFIDSRDIQIAERFRDRLREAPGRTLTAEVRIRQSKGRDLWVEYTATNLLDDPDVRAVVGKFRDISARKQAEKKIRVLSQRMIRLQQEEERRIARELHDSTAQSLTALMLSLGAAKSLPALSREVRSKLQEALELGRQIAREIRTASYLLHPPTLEDLGIVRTLAEYVRGFSERTGISVRFERPRRSFPRLSPEMEMAILRIVQEALSNVHRHSSSRSAKVALFAKRQRITLRVEDRGKGIAKNILRALEGRSSAVRLGIGLRGICERVRRLQGDLQVTSNHSGTRIRIEIPQAK
jgi:PAS domain S-box-containing protein